MNVTILHDRVLIKKIEVESTSAGGIVLAGSAAEQKFEGEVLKVGEGRTTAEGVVIPLSVKVGNRVMYYPNAGLPVKIEGQDLLVLREEEIYAVVE